MTRNKIWRCSPKLDWTKLGKAINSNVVEYRNAAIQRSYELKKIKPILFQTHWNPPTQGRIKFNFDVEFQDGDTITAMVSRNEFGAIMGAWTGSFKSYNPYGAETKTVIQACKNAKEMEAQEVDFKGDAANVILALQGIKEFEDWKVIHLLTEGHCLLTSNRLWSIQYCPRMCNRCAHILAKWAKENDHFGPIPLHDLPSSILEANAIGIG